MTTPDLTGAPWRVSSFSSGNNTCVEVAGLGPSFAVRDTEDRSGPALIFPTAEWSAFVDGVARGTLR